MQFPSETIGYTCGWLGGIYKTTNGGNSWYALNSGTSNVFRWMHFPGVNTGYAICGTNFDNPNMLYKTTNDSSWSFKYNFGSSTVLGGVYFFDADTGIVVGHNGDEAVLKTYNGGSTWEVKYTGPGTAVLQGLGFDGDLGWAVGSQGRIIKTTDRGETWLLDETVSPPVTLLGVCGAGGTAYAVGAAGTIYRATTVCIDSDQDGFGDPGHPENDCLDDNCPDEFNPGQEDSDQDDIGDACDWTCGDADASGDVDIDDVVYLIAYIFSGGPAPEPYESGDADCSGDVDIDDVVFLIAYIFSGGNSPCDTDGDDMPDC